VGKINLMKYKELPPEGFEAVTKVRYRDGGTLSTITPSPHGEGGGGVEVVFHANVKGIAPGQSAVFFEGDDVVGGGIIYGSSR